MESLKIITGLFLLILVSCGQAIYLDEILNRENDFKLTIHNGNKHSSDSSLVRILNKDSDEIVTLKDWISNNSDNWNNSTASWGTPDISVTGTDFRFLIFKDGVVVGFTDKNGNCRQFTKRLNKTEFDFLID